MANDLSFMGSYSGIDMNTVDSLIQAESGKLVQYTNKQATLTTEKTAWKDINTRLSSLYEKLGSLQEDATFKSRAITSSDTNKLTISAKTDAQLGDYSVQVNRLATSTTMTSGLIPSAADKTVMDALGLAGDFTITNQDFDLAKPEENTFSIDIKVEDSLKDIVGKINEQTKLSGVQAKIIDRQIILTDTKMGNRTFTVGGDLADDLGLDTNATLINGQSSEIEIDGITITKDTNTIEDAIDGVTLTLKELSEVGKPTTVTVKEDTAKTEKAIQDVVDQYNSILSFVGDQLDVGDPSAEKNKTGALVGDSTLMRLEMGLRSLMTANVNNGSTSVKNMSDLGITVDRAGKATLDSKKLKEALANDPAAVKNLFFNTEGIETAVAGEPLATVEKENGMAQKMRSLIDSYISEKTGIIANKSTTFENEIKDISKSITSFNERLEKKRTNYIAMFTRLDTVMMEAESQMAYLNSQFNPPSK
ncbi:flagellar filament capping protein FliD [Carnobacterium funditum]|uniref:flagellar filament capping protein FliD n=1 Tax=Carnobacterium funditum TaxID=2752 RepID=UPI0005547612|nr:flagellar filament capping protein FliD [Carnobacterium funditum]